MLFSVYDDQNDEARSYARNPLFERNGFGQVVRGGDYGLSQIHTQPAGASGGVAPGASPQSIREGRMGAQPKGITFTLMKEGRGAVSTYRPSFQGSRISASSRFPAGGLMGLGEVIGNADADTAMHTVTRTNLNPRVSEIIGQVETLKGAATYQSVIRIYELINEANSLMMSDDQRARLQTALDWAKGHQGYLDRIVAHDREQIAVWVDKAFRGGSPTDTAISINTLVNHALAATGGVIPQITDSTGQARINQWQAEIKDWLSQWDSRAAAAYNSVLYLNHLIAGLDAMQCLPIRMEAPKSSSFLGKVVKIAFFPSAVIGLSPVSLVKPSLTSSLLQKVGYTPQEANIASKVSQVIGAGTALVVGGAAVNAAAGGTFALTGSGASGPVASLLGGGSAAAAPASVPTVAAPAAAKTGVVAAVAQTAKKVGTELAQQAGKEAAQDLALKLRGGQDQAAAAESSSSGSQPGVQLAGLAGSLGSLQGLLIMGVLAAMAAGTWRRGRTRRRYSR